MERGHSVLDTINAQAKRLNGNLGARDQEKLDQYLTSVRELESDLTQSAGWLDRPKPTVIATPAKDITDRNTVGPRIRQMCEIIKLALQTDSTRVITYRINGLSTVPAIEGVTLNWHELSHHGQDPNKIAELRLIEEVEFTELAIFLASLRAIKEDNSTLLDNTSIIYGSNLGNASNHDWKNLPLFLAGVGFKHGSHLAFDAKNNLPLSNLFVQLLQKMGVEIDAFGTSTSTSVPGLV